jgi:hypothetical protein
MKLVASFCIQDAEQDNFDPFLLSASHQFALFTIHTIEGCYEDEDNHLEMEFETAIILQNFAVASWCLALVAENAATAHARQQTTVKILQMSDIMLERVAFKKQGDFAFQRIASVGITVLHALKRVLAAMGDAESTEAVDAKITDLWQAKQIFKDIWSGMTPGCIAAAAA